MVGTGVVCRSVRRRTMREIYSPHSNRHSAQNTLKSSEFTHVMLCYIVGERNLSPALPFGSCPHLWLKCRTPNIFLPLFSSPICGNVSQLNSYFLSHCQWTDSLNLSQQIFYQVRNWVRLTSLTKFLIWLCRTIIWWKQSCFPLKLLQFCLYYLHQQRDKCMRWRDLW